jgi:hypothetical protein
MRSFKEDYSERKTESEDVKVCTENRMKTQDPLNCNARLGGSGVDNNSH